MTPAEQARLHDANFAATFAVICALIPGGWAEEVQGVPVAVSGVPVPFFNAAWPAADAPEGAIRSAIDRLRESGLPFVVHVPADAAGPAQVAASHGLAARGRLPCFALEPTIVPNPPADLRIERVDAKNLEAFHDATVAGYEMPASLVEQFYPAAIVNDARIRAFVGRLDGQPVATSLASRTGETVGIYSVATAPGARGRGIGTAMTWHLLRDADPGWTLAVLQASDMGRPIYERMGFSLVREFDEYMAPPAG